MAKIIKQVGFTIEIDEEAIAPASPNVFIYQMLNRLNYEHEIQSVTVDGVTAKIGPDNTLYDLPLGEDQDLK